MVLTNTIENSSVCFDRGILFFIFVTFYTSQFSFSSSVSIFFKSVLYKLGFKHCSVAWAGLELVIFLLQPTRIRGKYHHVWL